MTANATTIKYSFCDHLNNLKKGIFKHRKQQTPFEWGRVKYHPYPRIMLLSVWRAIKFLNSPLLIFRAIWQFGIVETRAYHDHVILIM